ncbi:MAG: OmpA family protein [Stagnimonas sp.]|nr:OmpA family protein [Stagnimonas sp.]
MKNATRAALAATLIGLALPLHAEEFIDKRPYVSPMFAYTFDENDRGSEEGLGWYYGAGKTLNKYWNAELGTFYSRFNDRNGATGALWREYGMKLDGQFFYSREKLFSPYFGIGAGVQRTDVLGTGVKDTQPMVDAGLGFISWFDVAGYDVGLRGDARYRWAFLDKVEQSFPQIDQLNEPIIKVGLVLPVGPKVAVASTAAAGAAAGGSKTLDSDGDGVPDALDRCPGSARGALVDANGCPRDTTPATGGGARQFDDVLFEFDRSEVTSAGMMILDNAAEVVNSGAYKSLRVNIAGHTDWIGSEGYNQALSERRANAVRSYLVKKGVDASRIHTFAYGETTPKADNQSAEGRALNRRAEVKTGE